MKKKMSNALRLIVGIALLLFIFQKIDMVKILELVQHFSIPSALFTVVFILSLRVLMSLRWSYQLASYGVHVPLGEAVKVSYLSAALGQYLPGVAGPDIVMGIKLNSNYSRPFEITSTIIVDRVIGLYALCVISLFGTMAGELMGVSTSLTPMLVCINAACILGWYCSRPLENMIKRLPVPQTPLFDKIVTLLSLVTDRDCFRSVFTVVFFLSWGVQVIRCLLFYFLYRSFGYEVNFAYFLIFIPIVYLIVHLPVSVNGIGIREGALMFFFGTVGVPAEVSVGVGVIYQFLHVVTFAPGVLWGLYDRKRVRPEESGLRAEA